MNVDKVDGVENCAMTREINTTNHPFSIDVPDLLLRHLDQLVKESGISIEVIKERGYRSILGKKKLSDFGFSKTQIQTPTLLIPIHTPDGGMPFYIHRPDNPRKDNKGKDRKYEIPSGEGLRIDIPPRCIDKLKNPNLRLWITEGVKKADALASKGECVIDLLGVWGFKHKNEFGAITISADFDYIALKEREILGVFDNDVMTNPQVKRALDVLTEHLKRKGANVHNVYIPFANGIKVGVDDYLLDHSIEDLLKCVIYTGEANDQLHNQSLEYSFDSEGNLCRYKSTNNGIVLVPLANFDARIICEIFHDNGLETSITYEIEAKTLDKHLGKTTVTAPSFSNMSWINDFGNRAILWPGQTVKDYVRHHIQKNSNPETVKCYTHTGWRNTDQGWIYLTSDGAIGGERIDVSLSQELKKYSLPLKPENEVDAINASISFLDLGGKRITLPLFLFLYLSPLTTVLRQMPNFSEYLYGETGVFKSTLAIILLSHFGPFDSIEGLSNFEDTPNALGKRAFTLKDTIMVLDDYHPSAHRYTAQQKEMTAQRLIREFSNRTERARLNPDTTEKPRYSPRGLLLITGEELVSLQSSLARVSVVELKRGDIDKAKLGELQKKSSLLPHAMSSYIHWMIDLGVKNVQLKFNEAFPQFRDSASSVENLHPKLSEQVGFLQFAACNVLDWLLDKRIINNERAKTLRDESWDILINLACEHDKRIRSEDPVDKFVEVIKALIFQRKICIHNKELSTDFIGGDTKQDRAEPVGYFDDKFFYFLPDPLWNAIQRFNSNSGDFFPVSRNTLFNTLEKRGLIENRVSLRIGETVHKVIRTPRGGMLSDLSTMST